MLVDSLFKQLTPWSSAKRWLVGFSGGMDSTVLLHLLATLKTQYVLPELSAVYIHHGLQKVAEDWPIHCQQICDELAIPLTVVKVNVAKQASIEEAARNARYDAFKSLLLADDVLFTAQHQNDQAETLLFRLVRGAGVRGLASMPEHRALGQGELVRPLLNVPYVELKRYAIDNQLQWIDDPSNNDTDFARNYIRHKVMPVLAAQWPRTIAAIGQAASHLQEAQSLLNELALADLQAAHVAPLYPWLTVPSLLLKPLAQLSFARQKNALSYWLSQFTLLPTTQHWQGWQDLLAASESANPIWKLHQAELHRANGRIWLLTGQWLLPPPPTTYPVTANGTMVLDQNGQITLQSTVPLASLFIRYRQGGELIELAKRGRRDLKRLLNEAAIPLFVRHRLPLLFNQQGSLLAVANFPEWRDATVDQTIALSWLPNIP